MPTYTSIGVLYNFSGNRLQNLEMDLDAHFRAESGVLVERILAKHGAFFVLIPFSCKNDICSDCQCGHSLVLSLGLTPASVEFGFRICLCGVPTGFRCGLFVVRVFLFCVWAFQPFWLLFWQ